jgi:uncharacterized membrane protein YkvA (DUF1232 family)
MSAETDARCLEIFPEWLRTLGLDLGTLCEALGDESAPVAARSALAAAVNYVFKSVDLIPDGIDDIGYLDDAFVIRVAAQQCLAEGLARDAHDAVGALADEAALARDFLGTEHARLDRYVVGLRKGSARNRTVDAIVTQSAVRAELASDVAGFARDFKVPSFAREERTLIKLRAFFDARLPR